ncbi:hypothetical protein SNE40_013352 [Patella caerulea]|uniref:C3H1-type domain-containing protein n=1 Tax=Patella caerulea TaxID=87958 RepID=A0AAN8JN25_PATCE
MNNCRNWKKSRFVTEIEALGGVAHPSWNLSVLRQSYELTVARSQEGHTSLLTVTPNVTATQPTATEDIIQPTLEQEEAMTSPVTHASPSTTHACIENQNTQDGGAHNEIASATSALAKMVDVVHDLLKRTSKEENRPHDLMSAMQRTFGAATTPDVNSGYRGQTSLDANLGQPHISVKNLPKTDMISGTLRKQILEGKDVNLSSLLIPNFDLTAQSGIASTTYSSTLKDPKLTQDLSIEEFNLAFEKYKSIITSVFITREKDLNQYQRDINTFSRNYGPRFYLYHKMFSQKAAAGIQEHNTVGLWGEIDESLLNLVMHGIPTRACNICEEINHTTRFCPRNSPSLSTLVPTTKPDRQNFKNNNSIVNDKRGRSLVRHQGSTVCNNFNDAGCRYTEPECYYKHVCKTCFSTEHAMKNCITDKWNKFPTRSTKSKQNQQ